MPRVSSNKLNKGDAHELLLQLAKVFSGVKKKDTVPFLKALLTAEEQMMLAKRVAVLIMLRDGISTYRIVRVLKMSSSTVSRMKYDYETGMYEDLIGVLGKSRKQQEEFWKTIDVILQMGMPSQGKDRWKWLDKHTK